MAKPSASPYRPISWLSLDALQAHLLPASRQRKERRCARMAATSARAGVAQGALLCVRRELPMGELKNYTAFKDRMLKRAAVKRVVEDEKVKV